MLTSVNYIWQNWYCVTYYRKSEKVKLFLSEAFEQLEIFWTIFGHLNLLNTFRQKLHIRNPTPWNHQTVRAINSVESQHQAQHIKIFLGEDDWNKRCISDMYYEDNGHMNFGTLNYQYVRDTK